MTYRVKTGIHYPAPGHVPPPGERGDPKHEISPEIGSLVDLSHLSEVAVSFYLRNGCIEPVETIASAAPSVAFSMVTNHEEGGN